MIVPRAVKSVLCRGARVGCRLYVCGQVSRPLSSIPDSAVSLLAGASCTVALASLYANYRQYKEVQRLSAIEQGLSTREDLLKHKEELLHANQRSFEASMQSLAKDALAANSTAFIGLAKSTFTDMQVQAKVDIDRKQMSIKELVDPLQSSLRFVENKIEALERERLASASDIKRQIVDMISAQKDLRTETANLVRALRSPVGRGKWGELQLQRVIELSGMIQHCDFVQQQALDATNMRPDVIITLSNNRSIVVDAKTPLLAYLEAYECADEERRGALMQSHAKQLRAHINALSAKAYWDQFDRSPDFVVMFVPGESIFSAALNADPTLIEYGVSKRVILATPTTLISLLRVVALGWQHRAVEENAREIGQLGRECYKRLKDFTSHLENVGKYLGQAVGAYNQSVGSFERRVLVAARRFDELDSSVFAADTTATTAAASSSSAEGHQQGSSSSGGGGSSIGGGPKSKLSISEIDSVVRMPKVESKDKDEG